MKKILFLAACSILFATSCSETLEEKAQRDAKEYTEKFCPPPYQNDERTDSLSFNPATMTFTYYRMLRGKADNIQVINANKQKLINVIRESVTNDPSTKAYKQKGIKFRFEYRSASNPKIVLFDHTYTQKDYKAGL